MIFSKDIIKTALIGLFAAALGACSSDLLYEGDEPGVSKPAQSKFSFNIKVEQVEEEGGSRALDPLDELYNETLVDGIEAEQKIGKNGNFLILFDKDKKFAATALLTLSNTTNSKPEVIERTYTATLQPDELDKDPYENLPRYCLLILNGTEYFSMFDELEPGSMTSDEVIYMMCSGGSIGRSYVDGEEFFTMTNSVYYDFEGEKQTLVELHRDMIFDPTDPARMSLFPEPGEDGKVKQYEAPVMKVYVERIVAKFSLEFKDRTRTNGEYIYNVDGAQPFTMFNGFAGGKPTFTTNKWQIAVTGWNVNALEKEAHFIKNVVSGPDMSLYSTFKWQEPGGYRTYWCQDNNYDLGKDDTNYPIQYRRSVEKPSTPYYEKLGDRNYLRNFSYNEMDLDANNFDVAIYTPENTYNFDLLSRRYREAKDTIETRIDYLAGTHIIVGARLRIDAGDGKGYVNPPDLYRDRNGFFYTKEYDCFKTLLYGFNASLTSQETMRFTFYDWSGSNPSWNGKTFYASTSGELALYMGGLYLSDSQVELYFKNAKNFLDQAIIRAGDGRRLPWPSGANFTLGPASATGSPRGIVIKDENGNTVYTFRGNNAANNYDTDFVKSMMYEWVGAVDHYNEGRMYYAAPATIIQSDNDYIPGLCGVVRNNWFHYKIKNIKSIGTPVDDPNQPIVPDRAYNNDQINVTVRILDWHPFASTVKILQ